MDDKRPSAHLNAVLLIFSFTHSSLKFTSGLWCRNERKTSVLVWRQWPKNNNKMHREPCTKHICMMFHFTDHFTTSAFHRFVLDSVCEQGSWLPQKKTFLTWSHLYRNNTTITTTTTTNWATFESSSFITVPHTSDSLGGTRPPLWEPLLYVYQRWGEVCVGVTEAPRKHLWLWRLRCQMVFDPLCPPCNSCVPSLGGPSPTLGTTTLLPNVWE